MRNLEGDWVAQSKTGSSINFNFCHFAENTCEAEKDAFAFMKDTQGCHSLTSDEPKAELA